jgi:hypothetical protein
MKMCGVAVTMPTAVLKASGQAIIRDTGPTLQDCKDKFSKASMYLSDTVSAIVIDKGKFKLYHDFKYQGTEIRCIWFEEERLCVETEDYSTIKFVFISNEGEWHQYEDGMMIYLFKGDIVKEGGGMKIAGV